MCCLCAQSFKSIISVSSHNCSVRHYVTQQMVHLWLQEAVSLVLAHTVLKELKLAENSNSECLATNPGHFLLRRECFAKEERCPQLILSPSPILHIVTAFSLCHPGPHTFARFLLDSKDLCIIQSCRDPDWNTFLFFQSNLKSSLFSIYSRVLFRMKGQNSVIIFPYLQYTQIGIFRASFIYDTLLAVKIDLCVLGCFSRIQLFEILWSVARQAPLSLGFSRQVYWSGLLCPPPGDLSQSRDQTQVS